VSRAAIVALLLLGACGSTRVVDRADDGTPILLCGAQPTAESLARMQRVYGLKTVVNLRGARPEKAWFRDEARGIDATGVTWIQLRTSGIEPPEPEHLARFFEVVEDPANWPVFVHCESGMHRTGLVCAVYRMQYQGWDPERAFAEMRGHGFRLTRADRSAVEAFVRSYRPVPGRTIARAR
jgi:tyrosine-protein phosphatase SIW14